MNTSSATADSDNGTKQITSRKVLIVDQDFEIHKDDYRVVSELVSMSGMRGDDVIEAHARLIVKIQGNNVERRVY